MKNSTGLYPRLKVDGTSRCSAAGQAGGVLLTDTIRLSGLGSELSTALVRWRKPTAVHDPAKIIMDLAVTLALGGDCLAALAVSRLIELSAGWSIARFVKTLRRYHTVTIQAGSQTINAADPYPKTHNEHSPTPRRRRDIERLRQTGRGTDIGQQPRPQMRTHTPATGRYGDPRKRRATLHLTGAFLVSKPLNCRKSRIAYRQGTSSFQTAVSATKINPLLHQPG